MKETDLEQYLIIYYHSLLTLNEKLAYRHYLTTQKAESSGSDFGKILIQTWGTRDKEALKLLEDGYDAFKKKIATRLLKEVPELIFINNCPKCKKLARTPEAKQCRFCGHDWH